MHLTGALGVADVENLIFASGGLDRVDVGFVVVHAHVGPCPVPVGAVLHGERLVAPTVHSATIVANPDVVAGVHELEME